MASNAKKQEAWRFVRDLAANARLMAQPPMAEALGDVIADIDCFTASEPRVVNFAEVHAPEIVEGPRE